MVLVGGMIGATSKVGRDVRRGYREGRWGVDEYSSVSKLKLIIVYKCTKKKYDSLCRLFNFKNLRIGIFGLNLVPYSALRGEQVNPFPTLIPHEGLGIVNRTTWPVALKKIP